jgi:hypothetical protein
MILRLQVNTCTGELGGDGVVMMAGSGLNLQKNKKVA